MNQIPLYGQYKCPIFTIKKFLNIYNNIIVTKCFCLIHRFLSLVLHSLIVVHTFIKIINQSNAEKQKKRSVLYPRKYYLERTTIIFLGKSVFFTIWSRRLWEEEVNFKQHWIVFDIWLVSPTFTHLLKCIVSILKRRSKAIILRKSSGNLSDSLAEQKSRENASLLLINQGGGRYKKGSF